MTTTTITLSSSTSDAITAGVKFITKTNIISDTSSYIVYGDSNADTINFAASTAFNSLFGGGTGTKITGSSTVGNNLYTGGGAETVTGGSGNDNITVTTAGNTTIKDGNGNDNISVNASGTNTITVGTGNDVIELGNGSINTVKAGSGNDYFYVTGNGTTATITAGLGNDWYQAGSGTNVTISAIGGTDTLVAKGTSIVNATVASTGWTASASTVNSGTTTLTTKGYAVNLSSATGTSGFTVTDSGAKAVIVGSNLGDTITAGANDTITAGTGIDTINVVKSIANLTDLGNGADLINVATKTTLNATVSPSGWTGTSASTNNGTVNLTTAGVAVNVAAVSGTGTFSLTDTGGVKSVVLTGSATDANTFTAANGDTVIGGSAADTFNVNTGTQNITNLGNGADILVVGSAAGTIANASIASSGFTATVKTVNNGTANLTNANSNLTIDLTAAKGTNGFTVTDNGNHNILTASKLLNDSITGGAFDSITGGKGADLIKSGGNSVITAGTGAETIYAAANDTVNGSTGAETIYANGSNEIINGGKGAQTITVANNAANVTINSGTAANLFTVSGANTTITALGGLDVLDVTSSGTVKATVLNTAKGWTAGAALSNSGSVTITTTGSLVNLGAVNTGKGYTITDQPGGAKGILITGSQQGDTITGANGDSVIGGATANTFNIVAGVTETVENLGYGGADIIKVAATGVLNGTISTSGWTATSASVNNGTANLNIAKNTGGFTLDVHNITSGNGFTINDLGKGGNTIVGSIFGDTFNGAIGDTITGSAGVDIFNVTKATTETITDLGNGADVLNVATKAVANVTLSGAWTAGSTSSDLGTVNVNDHGFNLDVSAATGAGVWNITDTATTGSLTLTASAAASSVTNFTLSTTATEKLVFATGESGATLAAKFHDTIANLHTGDAIHYSTALTAGSAALDHITPAVSVTITNGVATFTGTIASAAVAIKDIVTDLGVGTTTNAGEFVFFNQGGNEYLFIASGAESVPSATDSLIQLTGLSAAPGFTVTGDIVIS